MNQTPNARPMRRQDRQLSLQEAQDLLRRAEYGVLSVNGRDGEPYAVPLSFVFDGEAVYFHCAKQGYKLDCLRADGRVCFSVVDGVQALYDDGFTTNYESAMLGGTATEVTERGEMGRALRLLCEKYLPDYEEKIEPSIRSSLEHLSVWRVAPRWISGKARRG